ncbi:MAG TPA: hypothetical protein VD907_06460 [Verrucomicrobiae bacterium]|nr:hypothetical protein [Verrucomicrobiae bacterium]
MAKLTVRLPRTTTGSELMSAVKAVAEQRARFYSSQSFDDGDIYQIGQRSSDPVSQIMVAPSREEQFIRLEMSYDTVVVMNHKWPVGETRMVDYEDWNSAEIETVRQFADALTRHLSGTTEEKLSSVWPQEVVVCALCGHIVTRDFDRLNCPTDGKNPPTRTVMVAPVTN